jgi:hypothetical protein
MTPREAAERYIARGWQVVPLRPRSKKCVDETDWLTKAYTPADFGATNNIGIKSFDGLLDVDCDCPEAVFMADALLPRTCTYGRPSNPRSHHVFQCAEITEPLSFKDLVAAEQHKKAAKDGVDPPDISVMLVEVRVKHQSMAPPSIHPDGEQVQWHEERDELKVDKPLLLRSVQLVATGSMIARYYNPPGDRHDWGMALAGFLRRVGVMQHEAERMVTQAAQWARDDKVKDRLDAVRNTYTRQEDAPTTGATKLKALIGENGKAFVATLFKIWEADREAEIKKGILVQGGKLTDIVDRAERALLTQAIYQRGGMLTRPVKLDKALGESNDVRRQAGSTVLSAVKEHWLIEQMGRVLKWHRQSKESFTQIDPPPIYARTLLSRGEWLFPVLRGVVMTPTLALDGRIISEPGFDAESGLLVDVTLGAFPPVPVAPTHEDAYRALDALKHPLRGFPFVDDAARSVALSALLTGLVRMSLRTAPLHGFDAPAAGTGKSLLAEMVGLLATGVLPPALSQGKTDDEDEKRLSTVLFAGDPVIHIDNCERAISGDFLCSMLTQEVVQARILGLSERRVLPATALVLASGNNLTMAGDTSRRAVMCRLDAQTEKPDTRVFDFDCHAEVLAARPALVIAGLTILRAYVLAGRPSKFTPMGSFNDWGWIRGALLWLDSADPADTRLTILENDPKKDELLSVLDLWETALGTQEIDLASIHRMAEDHTLTTPAVVELRDGLITSAGCREWNAKSIAWWLKRHKDRIVDGKCIRSETFRDRQHWKLAVVDNQSRFEG